MGHSSFLWISCSLGLLQWVLPLIGGSTQEPVLDCIPTLMVPRNTLWRAAPLHSLKINCTVFIPSHCWTHLSMSWCKVGNGNNCNLLNHSNHSTTEWRNISAGQRIIFLVFMNLSDEDSGLYRCKADAPVSTISHNINVTVEGNIGTEVERNKTNLNETQSGAEDWTWLLFYVYICGGVVLVVATVMLGSLLIIRCQRSKTSKKERKTDNQSTATQVANVPPSINDTINYQHGNTHSLPPQLSPACIYDIPPSRALSYRDCPSTGRRAANEVAPGRRHNRVNVKEEGEEEEDSPLVYASLNHKLRGPIKVSHSELENSEYAIIKIS